MFIKGRREVLVKGRTRAVGDCSVLEESLWGNQGDQVDALNTGMWNQE